MKSKCHYLPVPINKTVHVLIDQLNNEKGDLMRRTELFKKYIHELAELCLSKCYFLWNNAIRILKDLGPTGLRFMVVLSENYAHNLGHKALAEASTFL